ncbi:MAG: efflux RND transporter periplasmic adaptor subunit [bacterium]|nr:efflux RND transporter periplasmic adaptor subunit [bacterium]
MQEIARKRIILILGVLISIGLIVIAARSCGGDEKYNYEYGRVTAGEVRKTISVTGVLEVIDPHRVLSKIGGMVENVYVDFNDRVKKGQILALLDAAPYNKALDISLPKLEIARLNMAAAKKDYEGKQKLFKENLVSKVNLDSAKLSYKNARNAYKASFVDYNGHRENKRNCRIVSPSGGIILNKNVESNLPVGANHLCFEIASTLKTMRLIISIDEADIGIIKTGQKVFFSVSAFPEKVFTGKISQVRINPVKSGGLVTYQSQVICDNEELLLKPGMTATATVEVSKKQNALRVKNQALIVAPLGVDYDTEKKYIWKKSSDGVDGLPVVNIEVKTDLVGDMYTEIVSTNLKKGDEVLVAAKELEK